MDGWVNGQSTADGTHRVHKPPPNDRSQLRIKGRRAKAHSKLLIKIIMISEYEVSLVVVENEQVHLSSLVQIYFSRLLIKDIPVRFVAM